jgi:hypothetical protein
VVGGGKDLGHLVFRYKNGDESWGWYSGTYKITMKSDGSWEVAFSGASATAGLYRLGGLVISCDFTPAL